MEKIELEKLSEHQQASDDVPAQSSSHQQAATNVPAQTSAHQQAQADVPEEEDIKGMRFGCFQTKLRAALYFIALLVAVAIILVCITVVIVVKRRNNTSQDVYYRPSPRLFDDKRYPYVPLSQSYYNQYDFRYASVACSDVRCSTIGSDILAEGGSVVDAAIAVSLCLGVYRPAASGIGGGGFMTYYERSTKKAHTLNYLGRSGMTTNSTMYETGVMSLHHGGGSIMVPGEVAGMWHAHQQYGRLKWARLFQPSIDIMIEGYEISQWFSEIILNHFNESNLELKALFTDENGTGKTTGDIMRMPKLAETYRRIAEDGAETFYNGSLKDDIVADLQEIGDQVLTKEDLEAYQVDNQDPLISKLSNGNFTLISPPPPSSGAISQYIMNILDGYDFNATTMSCSISSDLKTESYHKIIEAWKFAFAAKIDLGDPKFVNMSQILDNLTSTEYAKATRELITNMAHETSYYGKTGDSRLTTGGSQISITAGNGDAVSVTTSLNSVWGSKMMGRRTGIIFNSHMSGFSLPTKPDDDEIDTVWISPSNQNNWIQQGKQPLSPLTPTIALDQDGNVRLVTGGTGGSKAITIATMTMIDNLWFNFGLSRSIISSRLHHQLMPAEVLYEEGFSDDIITGLESKGHRLTNSTQSGSSDSVSREDGQVYGVGDKRAYGGSDGF